jgi:hypothetical protein
VILQSLTKRRDSRCVSKIPGAPASRIRPVSANTMTHTRIPRPGTGSPSPAASPVKRVSCQDQTQAVDSSATTRTRGDSARTGTAWSKVPNGKKASPLAFFTTKQDKTDEPRLDDTASTQACGVSADAPEMSRRLFAGSDVKCGSFGDQEGVESSVSVSGASNKSTLSRLGSGLHDSTEIGWGEALEV